MTVSNGRKILVSGASFAGLSSAWWMSELGYEVTIVESSPALRTGGTAVNIRGDTIATVKRMGLFDAIRANRLDLRQWDFKNADDSTARRMTVRAEGAPQADDDYEIERDVLVKLLHDAVKDRCGIVFGDSIAALEQTDRIEASFRKGERRAYDLVLGCDGTHSNVRKLWFGDEAPYVHFLQQYFSITIVDKLLIERDTAQLFNVPGKAVMLNAYKNKTDIIFAFFSEADIAYRHRDEQQQRQMIAHQFATVGWRSAELLNELDGSDNFYFDKLCQIRMPAWSRGRVVLVGDAGYCPSPAAGMGGSLAIEGAAALGNAMQWADGDLARAFRRYEDTFRPFVEEVQADAVRAGLESLVPRTEEAIRERNSRTDMGF